MPNLSELMEENRQLRKLLYGDFKIPWDWGLSASQTSMLKCLLAQPEASYEVIINAVYGSREVPDSVNNVIRVQMKKLRKNLEPLGVEIHVRSGFGYFISKDDRTKLKKMVKSNGNK